VREHYRVSREVGLTGEVPDGYEERLVSTGLHPFPLIVYARKDQPKAKPAAKGMLLGRVCANCGEGFTTPSSYKKLCPTCTKASKRVARWRHKGKLDQV
jgi:hypothetical protein